ncbi:Abi-alpha family protein [Nocardia terpenica]|uniref:Abi-alpha family protein n=1 Tax=Nocardia terpenica TaxID=455432 RepID=UPI001EEAD34F|nr:Abi-alpha family protein [Nocardia terpenica]
MTEPDATAPPHSTELVPRPAAELIPVRTSPVRAAIGLVRVAAAAVTEVTAWGVGTALNVTGTVVRGGMAGRPPAEVLTEAGEQVRDSVRRALGIPPPAEGAAAPVSPALRDRGAELLRLSASVHGTDDDHPAYARMLTELAPDEARILRLLYLDGAQPALDIRTGRPLSPGAERAAMGVNSIGEDAALRFPDRIDPYLTNLSRLGLIEFTRDPLDDPTRYQLLEARPDMRKLRKRTAFGTRVHYRSIALTTFGSGFVRTCLPVPPMHRAL